MGAFRYCRKCDAPLSRPTVQEDLIDGQTCSSCGQQQPNVYDINEWVIEAFDEIENLKKIIGKMRTRGFTKLDKRIQRLSKQNKALREKVNRLEIELKNNLVI